MPLKNFLFRLTDRMEDSWIVQSISRSLILLLPIIFITDIVSLIRHLPWADWQIWLATPAGGTFKHIMYFISHSVTAIFALLFAGAMGWNFARQRAMPPYQTILMPCMSIVACIILSKGYFIYYSPRGLLTAVIASLLACSLYSALAPYLQKKFQETPLGLVREIRALPKLREIMSSLLPLSVVILLIAVLQEVISNLLNMPLQQYVNYQASDLVMRLSDHPLGVDAVLQLIAHIFWFFGINGTAITDSAIAEFYKDTLLSGVGPTSGGILNPGFHNAYLQIGGCGSALALVLAVLWVSRHRIMRSAAKMSLIPSLFNIGEFTVCSLPLVGSPIYFLPFLLVPLVNLYPTAMATEWGLLPVIAERIHPNTPVFLNSYLGSHSLYAPLVQMALLTLDVFIYLPFVKLDEERKRQQFAQKVRALEAYCQEKEEKKERWLTTDLTEAQSVLMAELGSDLAQAMKTKDGLYMVYQPQIDHEGKNIGAEALIRWEHPMAGFIYPPLVITIARMNDRLHDLEAFIFTESALAVSKLQDQLGSEAKFKISVNITGDALSDDRLEEIIEGALERAGIFEERIWIEVTEQDAITLSVETMERLARLKQKGHKLVIDDFGMGHTSIRYLQWGIFDVVKLDGSITKQALEDERSQQIIASLTSLSEQMNMVSVAEYVDNAPQRDKLKELGCDIFQGYLYSKPLKINDLLGHYRK